MAHRITKNAMMFLLLNLFILLASSSEVESSNAARTIRSDLVDSKEHDTLAMVMNPNMMERQLNGTGKLFVALVLYAIRHWLAMWNSPTPLCRHSFTSNGIANSIIITIHSFIHSLIRFHCNIQLIILHQNIIPHPVIHHRHLLPHHRPLTTQPEPHPPQ